MIAQRGFLLLLALAASSCSERTPRNESGGATTPPYVRAESDPSLLREASLPVRVGELGPGFAACNARGATRDRSGASSVAVRAAPFDATRESDRLPAGGEFFVCSRTHDQRWFGIVYDRTGDGERCGVSAPAPRRRAYPGPCDSGWVASAQVRLVSGVPHQLPPAAESAQVPPPAPAP